LPLIIVRKRPTFISLHSTPLGSASLLQVSTNSEEAQQEGWNNRAGLVRTSCFLFGRKNGQIIVGANSPLRFASFSNDNPNFYFSLHKQF
jgi:hypothetical protein